MNKNLKVASLAAAIALAMGSTAAMAASPTATQLPGKGKVVVTTGTVTPTIDATAGTMTVAVAGNTVIDWGKGTAATDLNPAGVGGFNIGSAAKVDFSGGFGVLNIDSSGNASQILGKLNGDNNLFVANTNGIIVGQEASITATGSLGLIANTIEVPTTYDGKKPINDGTGGNVTVAAGATLDGSSILITGGNVVNVDVGALAADKPTTIRAGLPSDLAGPFSTKNAKAMVNLTHADSSVPQTGRISALGSAGGASTAGVIDLSALNPTKVIDTVAGTFTNNGELTGPTNASEFAPFAGGFVNNAEYTGTGTLTAASIVNNGAMGTKDTPLGSITTSAGGITNAGTLYSGALSTSKGGLSNTGVIESAGGVTTNGGGLSNDGNITVAGGIDVSYGNVVNNGNIKDTAIDGGTLTVTGGSITNNGKLDQFYYVATEALPTTDAKYVDGADGSITNAGAIISNAWLGISVASFDPDDSKNTTTGSFTNSGQLWVDVTNPSLYIYAQNDVTLGGSISTTDNAKTPVVKAVSATNPLDYVGLRADGNGLGNGGVLSVNTGLYSTGGTYLYGDVVKLYADVSGGDWVEISAGDKLDNDYAVRVAKGVTVSGDQVYVSGMDTGLHPNVILQGTVAGNDVTFGYGSDYAVSDVFSGPEGGIVMTGADPSLTFDFTGRIKTAPYLNQDNFRYNALPVSLDDTASGAVALALNPVAYQTNGTDNGLSAVNLLVDGDVTLSQNGTGAYQPVGPGGTAVTGVTNIPNTHLVLQSTGNIDVAASYWPGYVYLGTISADADGNPLPGTLGLGQISLDGDFSNVLPGNVDGASGIHFMTQFPVDFGGTVTTNANAWVNFATDVLTQKAQADNEANPFLYGGYTSGTSKVVTYGVLDADSIHTKAPVADNQ